MTRWKAGARTRRFAARASPRGKLVDVAEAGDGSPACAMKGFRTRKPRGLPGGNVGDGREALIGPRNVECGGWHRSVQDRIVVERNPMAWRQLGAGKGRARPAGRTWKPRSMRPRARFRLQVGLQERSSCGGLASKGASMCTEAGGRRRRARSGSILAVRHPSIEVGARLEARRSSSTEARAGALCIAVVPRARVIDDEMESGCSHETLRCSRPARSVPPCFAYGVESRGHSRRRRRRRASITWPLLLTWPSLRSGPRSRTPIVMRMTTAARLAGQSDRPTQRSPTDPGRNGGMVARRLLALDAGRAP